jgi:hypothetical protein
MPHPTTRLSSRLPSPALVVAVFALLVALGGTGYALAAIPKHSVGAAELKKNAVRSKAVKDHSLKAKDFRAGQLPPSEVFIKNSGDDGVPVTALVGAGADTVIRSMSLPAGTYYVRATVLGVNQSAAIQGELRCFLRSSGDVIVAGTFGLYVPLEPNAGTNADRGFFSLDAAYQLTAPATVSVECNEGALAQTMEASASLSAIQVAHVTSVP